MEFPIHILKRVRCQKSRYVNFFKKAYLDISSESVVHAHSLGRVFSADKCSLLIVKFSSFKNKKVFVSKPQLRCTNISISEDVSIETRNVRRILTEFGKASNEPFKLSFAKLYVNSGRYFCCPNDNRIRELRPNYTPNKEIRDVDSTNMSTAS